MIHYIISKYVKWIQSVRNSKNRKRLTNKSPSIISANCIGCLISHWLQLPFNSPFVNLYIEKDEYIELLENFDLFISSTLTEVNDCNVTFPVGQIIGIKIYFMHYKIFQDAKDAWERRLKRIDKNNLGIIFPNLTRGDDKIIERFERLSFKNKIAFSDYPYDSPSVCYIKNWKLNENQGLFHTCNYFTGKRIIDNFDYVSWINKF